SLLLTVLFLGGVMTVLVAGIYFTGVYGLTAVALVLCLFFAYFYRWSAYLPSVHSELKKEINERLQSGNVAIKSNGTSRIKS
ncbi:MAG: hypothetical protein ACE5GF_02460, partial [Thermodesulfobacteriota bacterium]